VAVVGSSELASLSVAIDPSTAAAAARCVVVVVVRLL